MDFAFTEEQQMLRDQARTFLANEFGESRVTELADSSRGWDPEAWTKMAELGWTGLSVPEQSGGAGMGFLEEAVLFEELGYALYPGPFFATVGLALPALVGSPELLGRVAAGDLRATLAIAEPEGAAKFEDASGVKTEARRSGAAWELTGAKELVTDLAAADLVVVVARSDDGPGLWTVETAHAPIETHSTMDTTRRLGSLELDGAAAALVVEPGVCDEVLGRIRRRAYVALALEAVGVAQRVLELARDHAAERRQFDKPIGTYQAVSHPLADTYMDTEMARSLAYWAAWLVAEGESDAPRAAAAAKAFAADAAVSACERSIQVHGGIGFTWEHVLHRYYKRAQGIAAFDGAGASQRAEVAGYLLDA